MKKSKYIDHTLLKQDATKDMIIELCNQAKEHDFASVCVNPYWIKDCYQLLKDTDVKVCTVIGFPLGANTTSTKVFEAKQAIEDGATELDMVINISALKSKQDEIVFNDIKAIKDEAKDIVLKVIIETCLLTKDEIVKACELAMKANADFVKTSTGFSTSGAQVEDVKLMKETVKNKLEVKASGGIKTKEDFDAMVEAGATRVGTSNGVALL